MIIIIYKLRGHYGIICKNNPLLFVDPWGLCASLGENIGQMVQWYTQDLNDLPQKAKTAGTVLALETAAIVGYAVYPVVITTILTHPQETLDFVEAAIPVTTPRMTPSGVAGYTFGRIIESIMP